MFSQGNYSDRLDLSIGGDEVDPAEAGAPQALIAILDQMKPKGLIYRFTLYPGETHTSVKSISFAHGLTWIYEH